MIDSNGVDSTGKPLIDDTKIKHIGICECVGFSILKFIKFHFNIEFEIKRDSFRYGSDRDKLELRIDSDNQRLTNAAHDYCDEDIVAMQQIHGFV